MSIIGKVLDIKIVGAHKMRYVNPTDLTFSAFQTLMASSQHDITHAKDNDIRNSFENLKSRGLNDYNKIEDSFSKIKTEHHNEYKAVLSLYNQELFPPKKISIAYFFSRIETIPTSTRDTFKELIISLPSNFTFMDIVRAVAKQEIISTMENFDMSCNDIDIRYSYEGMRPAVTIVSGSSHPSNCDNDYTNNDDILEEGINEGHVEGELVTAK
jgi:hypothetical protein